MAGPELAQGSLIAGRYRLDRNLGEGGMGTVWSATHSVTRRSVAIKFLKPSLQNKSDVRQRFLREAQAASSLRHPHVVEVLDVFDLEDRSPVMVMELLEGETLGQKLARDERLSTEETAAIMLPVIAAVGSAHAAGIVHRDLKPENIFLAQAGTGLVVKVLDFGIAKLSAEHYLNQGQSVLVTEAGSLLGTPCYMAPEQINNVGVDHRADIWSLGVILYECLSGTRPIEGQNMIEVVSRLMNEVITPLERLAPELPHELAAIVQRSLSRDPKRRPQELGELSRVLGHYTHVNAPSFGPPIEHHSIDEGMNVPVASDGTRVSGNAARSSIALEQSTPAKARLQNATMQSAPAVGLDGTGGGQSSQSKPSGSPPRYLFVAAASGLVVFAVLWSFRTGETPTGAPTSTATSPPTAQVPIDRPPETAPAPPVTDKPAPSATPAVEKNESGPGEKTSKAKLRRARPVGAAVPKAPATRARTEDSLFSGRK